jgi:hypothetical protein
MGFKVDFTNVETKNFDPVPKGKYLLAVTDFEVLEIKDGKNAGQPRVSVEFTTQAPEMVGDIKIGAKKQWANFYPTLPATLFMLKGFLEALGIDCSGEWDFDMNDILARDYDQRLVVGNIVIQPERENKSKPGETYPAKNEIKTFYPASTWKGDSGSGEATPAASKSLLP